MVPNFGEGGGVGEVFIGGRLSASARFFCIQAMSYRFEYSTNLATGPPINIPPEAANFFALDSKLNIAKIAQ